MARPPASADVFRAIADPTRRRIIELLEDRPRSAGEIANAFDTCQSTVSEHLAVLRRVAVVEYSEEAGRRIYRLRPAPLREVAHWSARWSGEPSRDRTAPGRR